MMSMMGLVAVVVACYIGYAHPTVAGTDLPAAVGNWFDSILPAEWKGMIDIPSHKQQRKVQDAKDSSQLLETIPDLHVPCGYIVANSLHYKNPSTLDAAEVNPLDTIVDPSLEHSTISKDVVLKDRYLKVLYGEVGELKQIPANYLFLRMGSLEATVLSPRFLVVDEDPNDDCIFKMRLGRDFMKANQARIDLDEMEMYVAVRDKPQVMIPFLKTRSSLDLGGGTTTDEL